MNNTHFHKHKKKKESQTSVLTETEKEHRIILFNDNVNTFDFVIETLVEVCNHDFLQAEQCSLIVHYKGKCDVMTGSFSELEPPCSELLRRGLTAEII
jgi:ATP-dependent Clp protease adaptor protein ClpS